MRRWLFTEWGVAAVEAPWPNVRLRWIGGRIPRVAVSVLRGALA